MRSRPPHVRGRVLPPMLTLAGTTLYAVQGAVYALDAATGTVQAHFADHTFAPVAVGDAIYAIISMHPTSALLALDPLTGIARWRYEITGYFAGAPVVVDEAIVLGVSDGFVDAVDPRDGALRWRHETGGMVFAPPTVAAGVAYCSAAVTTPERPAVAALRVDNGALLWQAEIPRVTTLPLLVAGGSVYIGGGHALGADDGAELWHQPWPGSRIIVSTPLAFADGALFAAYEQLEHVWEPPGAPRTMQHAGVMAIRAAGGEPIWLQSLGADTGATRASALAVAAGALYTGSDDGEVNALRASDGTLLWRTHLGDLSFGAPVATPGAVYIGASDGAVYALRSADGALLWRAFVSVSVTVVASASITAMHVSQPAPDAAGGPPDPPDPPDPSGAA